MHNQRNQSVAEIKHRPPKQMTDISCKYMHIIIVKIKVEIKNTFPDYIILILHDRHGKELTIFKIFHFRRYFMEKAT